LIPLVKLSKNREEGWIKAYQALQTVLALARLSKEIPDLDLSSIEEPRKSPQKEYDQIISDFRKFCKEQTIVRKDLEKPVIFSYIPRMRLSKGPNREVTLASSVQEAKALVSDKSIFQSIKQ
jgi:hypothetical protein